MPQSYITDRNSGFLSPTLIPDSAGDREEARVKRLLDLAKLHQIQLEPQFEQRRLSLAERGLGLESQKAATAKDLGYRGQDIEMRGQDVTTRGQDLAQKANAEELRQRTLSHIISTAASRPDISAEQWAEVANQFGFPEVSNSFKVMHEQTQDDKAKKLTAGLIAAQQSGDPKSYTEFLNTIKAHPETADLTPRILKSLPKEYDNVKTDLDPKKPGIQTTGPNFNDAELIAAQRRASVQSAVVKAEADRIRRIGEHFRARKRAGLEEGKFDPTTPFSIPGYLH